MKTLARWIALMVTLSTVALARAGPPKIEVSPAVYDFGTIAETAQVETTISVHNAGESTLEILSVTTSCGCTKAQVADEKIEPGQTTTVKIIFDARSHVGERKTPQETPEAVVHAVYLRTNDPQRPEVEIEIRAQLISPSPALREGVGVRSATIYYNEACHDCTIYLDHELIPLLQELGIRQITKKDYISERKNRTELLERSMQLQVPPKLQGHLTVFLDDKIILQGHVPLQVVRDLLKPENLTRFERIVVLQDKMASHGDVPTRYFVWSPKGDVKEYPIETSIETYLAWVEQAPSEPASPTRERPWDAWGFLALVLGAGLLDGINPCAFSVLFLFMAFLFTLQRARSQMLQAGLVYIAAIYVTYLAIGLGILRVFTLSSEPHLIAKIGAGLMIVLGLVNIKDTFWYGRWFSLGVLKVGAETRARWMQKATLPATAVLGFLVGICEFPCTGGVYVGVLGLLAAQTTYLAGLGYLVLYNVMFVLPLVAILVALGNRRVLGQVSRWEVQHKQAFKLGQGLVMIALGVGILLWFV
jgi:cytochrome c-type biogenesis protein